MRPYPKVIPFPAGVKPNSKLTCEFCGKDKTNKKIIIAITQSDHKMIYCHADCANDMTEKEILAFCVPGYLTP